jgi:hypothetical protein
MKVHEKSFVNFIYSFLFEPEEFEVRVKTADQALWQGRKQPLRIWQETSFPEEDFLPYVALYLNPRTNVSPTARMWTMESSVLRSPKGLGSSAEWALQARSKAISFVLGSVELALFRIGVGFIIIRARPLSDQLSDWLDFLHFFRFVNGQRQVSIKAQRSILDLKTHQPQSQPFFPELAGGITKHPEGQGTFSEVINALLCMFSSNHEAQPWWHEVFVHGQLIPFAVLYVDRLKEKEVPYLLYRVRNFFHSEQAIHPAPEDLLCSHPSLLPYADNQWFIFSLEGGAFVACDAPNTDFFRNVLPAHLRDQYFLLFLLTLHQRFALMSMSQEVSEHWLRGDEAERVPSFERIRDRLLEFTARGYFAQVMQREHHHRVYRKWQEVLQLERLYQEVRDEVREMYDELLLRRSEAEERASRSLERMVAWLGPIIGVTTIVLAFLGINLRGITLEKEGLPIEYALIIAGIALLLGVFISWRLLASICQEKR